MNGLRIGLLGGSFNPAHDGHRHISLLALQRLRLDVVWWLVSPQNPLKSEMGMAALEDRLATARQVARHPRIKVSDLERKLGTRYTVDTLRELSRRRRQDRFVWIVGADNLMQMPKWRRWADIFEMVPVAVLARPSYSPRSLSGPAAHRFARNRLPDRMAGLLADHKPPAWVFLHTPLHNASATQIRSEQLTPAQDVTM